MKILLSLLFVFTITVVASEPITPIPEHIDVNVKKAALGKKLFFDTLLSRDKSVNCATCHILQDGGDDNLPYSYGINGQQGSINSPTVYNALFNFREFWNGRAKNLQEQASGPIENPKEMGYNFKDLIKRLKKTPYNALFHKIYKDGITKKNITNAIAEYEKTLITPNSPFDRYLRGDKHAITKEQKEGYELFKAKGCIACHQGMNVGGNMYNKFGIFTDSNSTNLGRYEVTHKEKDKYYFKVPSLRNIARTAPYFHDGRTYNLKVAVYTMAKYQLGRKITPQEVDKIVAFLHSLNGEIPKNIEPE
jgi:cytochrome c peroxidase